MITTTEYLDLIHEVGAWLDTPEAADLHQAGQARYESHARSQGDQGKRLMPFAELPAWAQIYWMDLATTFTEPA